MSHYQPWAASDAPLLPRTLPAEPSPRPLSRGVYREPGHPTKPDIMDSASPYIFDQDALPCQQPGSLESNDPSYPIPSIENGHAQLPLAGHPDDLKSSAQQSSLPPHMINNASMYAPAPYMTPELSQRNSYASSYADSLDDAPYGASPYMRAVNNRLPAYQRSVSESVLPPSGPELAGTPEPCVSLSDIQHYGEHGDEGSHYDSIACSETGTHYNGSPLPSRYSTPAPYDPISRSCSPFQRYPSPGPSVSGGYPSMQRSYSDHSAPYGAARDLMDPRARAMSRSPFQAMQMAKFEHSRPGVYRSDSMSSLSKASPLRNARTSTPQGSFPCPLAPYGCSSSFGSKNEWKRHVNTQHLRLDIWRCDQCQDRGCRPNDFNRKDLFIQHLRRMHSKTDPMSITDSLVTAPVAPPAPKRSRATTLEETDPQLVETEKRCHICVRSPPLSSRCLFCPAHFSGQGSFEERMEHIGRHLEQNKKEGRCIPSVADWNQDEVVEEWLESEGLIIAMGYGWQIADGRNVARQRAG